ncbi:MAG: hypothetical protein ACPG7E_04600 [Marinirhabdus sp.]
MKKAAATLVGLFLLALPGQASTLKTDNHTRSGYDGTAYIFVEGSVEFSVFPDGQFDFVYVGPRGSNVQVAVSTPNARVSFNSGHDYDMYVQYDDYGAVLQVEEVPIYYDNYGRIAQAGSVHIRYNNRRIVRVGGLRVHYNNYGHYSHCSGYINLFNPYYVYRPWHVYYLRPLYAHCIVYDIPYRAYYAPVRYSWGHHRRYYKNPNRYPYSNSRRNFYRPGSRRHFKDGRVATNRDYDPNRRNTFVQRDSRRDSYTGSAGRRDATGRSDRTKPSGRDAARTTARNTSKRVGKHSASRKGVAAQQAQRPKRNSSRAKTGKIDQKRSATAKRRSVLPKKTERSSTTYNNRGGERTNRVAPKRGTQNRGTVSRSAPPAKSKSQRGRGRQGVH